MGQLPNHFWSPYWFWESTLPSFICDEIINRHENQGNFIEGKIESSPDYKSKSLRKSDVIFSDDQWINAILYGYVIFANNQNFNYELTDFDKECAQLTRYVKGEFYNLHRDFCPTRNMDSYTRKLSATVQLSDSDDYEGGDLVIDMSAYDEDYTNRRKNHKMTRCKGSVIVFDSRLPHEVTPVTRGTRYSLVKWVHGDKPLR